MEVENGRDSSLAPQISQQLVRIKTRYYKKELSSVVTFLKTVREFEHYCKVEVAESWSRHTHFKMA
jgi:hypothetical protein